MGLMASRFRSQRNAKKHMNSHVRHVKHKATVVAIQRALKVRALVVAPCSGLARCPDLEWIPD